MRDEVLSSVGAEDMDTSGCQLSDHDDFQLYWENDQLDVDAVSRQGLDTPFSSAVFNYLEMGGSAEKHNLLDEEKYKESPPTTATSERPTHPPGLVGCRPFGTRICFNKW